MKKGFAAVILCLGCALGGVVIVFSAPSARAQQIASAKAADEPSNVPPGNSPGVPAGLEPDSAIRSLDSLPPAPRGKTTILGGQIRSFDPVRDEFALQIYGQRPMKVWFDERTQVYRDGKRIPVRDLGPADHASVQTILDGENVFAVSIHILTGSAEGECEGRVLRFNEDKGELVVSSQMSPAPVTFRVPANTSIARVGERGFTAGSAGSSDLVAGTLVSVSFGADTARRNIAREIKVLAVPGAAFVFTGNISFLNMQMGTMVLVDPRDGKSYEIQFDSGRLPSSASLHTEANVTVTATYDGARYSANAITMN
ncbi:MAG TPA: hypothetical protein VGG45_18165 [Terracidiphilus sp.]|jgi:hypothetical protein